MRTKAVKLIIAVVLTGALLNLGSHVSAQDLAPAAPTKAETKSAGVGGGSGEKKKTKIDFEDELVEGELKKPELFYLLQKKQFNFKRLIKLREDFLPEMRRDADEVRRSRSK